MESLFVMVFAQFVFQTNSFERSHDPSHPRAATTSLDCALTDTQTQIDTPFAFSIRSRGRGKDSDDAWARNAVRGNAGAPST
jgi:hypothetical protein